MNAGIPVAVRYARQAHHTALWARGMAKLHPHAKQFWLASARRCKAQARSLIRSARKWSAA